MPLAQVKGELLKYLSDTNRVPWERSAAFKDDAICGVGWTEETIRADKREEPVMVKHVPWRQMRWDPFSRSNDLSDARFVSSGYTYPEYVEPDMSYEYADEDEAPRSLYVEPDEAEKAKRLLWDKYLKGGRR